MAQLCDLLELNDACPEDIALAIAADEYPSLSAARELEQIATWAAQLRAQIDEAGLSGQDVLPCLYRYVYGQLGFSGDEDYDEPRASYLNDVIARRRGSPVAMAVLLMAIGGRAGVLVEPIGYPGHFLVRVEGMYMDPCDGGHPIDRDKLLALAVETLGDSVEAARRLEPVGPRAVGVRLLLNLQRIYRQRGDHARSLLVCDHLFDLTEAPFYRADRGVHALALGATRAAINDFEIYLEACPEAADGQQVRRLLERARRSLLRPAN